MIMLRAPDDSDTLVAYTGIYYLSVATNLGVSDRDIFSFSAKGEVLFH